jgi:hypothetical protein
LEPVEHTHAGRRDARLAQAQRRAIALRSSAAARLSHTRTSLSAVSCSRLRRQGFRNADGEEPQACADPQPGISMGKQPPERYKGSHAALCTCLRRSNAILGGCPGHRRPNDMCAGAEVRTPEWAHLRQVTSRAASRVSNLVDMDHAVLRRAAADLASDVRDPRWHSMHGGLHVRCVRRRVALAHDLFPQIQRVSSGHRSPPPRREGITMASRRIVPDSAGTAAALAGMALRSIALSLPMPSL